LGSKWLSRARRGLRDSGVSEGQGTDHRNCWRADCCRDRRAATDERHHPWSGFLLEKHDAAGRQDVCWGWHRTHVALFTKGSLAFRINEPANNLSFVAKAGSVCIFPSGFAETHFSLTESEFEEIAVELDPARLEALAGRKAVIGALTPQIVVEDAEIAGLLKKMASEVAPKGVPPDPFTASHCPWHSRVISWVVFQ
jgi:hypothetical protein